MMLSHIRHTEHLRHFDKYLKKYGQLHHYLHNLTRDLTDQTFSRLSRHPYYKKVFKKYYYDILGNIEIADLIKYIIENIGQNI